MKKEKAVPRAARLSRCLRVVRVISKIVRACVELDTSIVSGSHDNPLDIFQVCPGLKQCSAKGR